MAIGIKPPPLTPPRAWANIPLRGNFQGAGRFFWGLGEQHLHPLAPPSRAGVRRTAGAVQVSSPNLHEVAV